MIETDKYPLYEVNFGDDTPLSEGIELISLVKKPAIIQKGIALSENEDVKQYKFKAIDKQFKVVGPFLIPNIKILQVDEDKNPYYMTFTDQACVSLYKRLKSTKGNKIINLDHTETMLDAYILSDWQIEDERFDKSKMYGFNLPKNTCFIEVQFNNQKEYKEYVENEDMKSFSIQGYLSTKLVRMSQELYKSNWDDLIDSLSDEDVLSFIK